MLGEIAVRLQFIAGNPNLTFIFFIAYVLLGVLAVRFAYYAYRNRQTSDLVAEHRLWDYLVVVGVLALAFALFGVLEIVTTLVLPLKGSFVLAQVFVLALSMRVLYRRIVPTSADGSRRFERPLTRAAVVGIVAVFLGLAIVGRHTAVVGVMGLSTLSFAVAGISFGHRGAGETRVQGTVIDTLLRHLLPVLLFASLVPVVDLATLVGLSRAVVLHVQVVFVIMTATALMTATIKLRQNLASF